MLAIEDVERELIVLKWRMARRKTLRQCCYDIMPVAVNIAVILLVIVQLLSVDNRLDVLEQRMTPVQ